ncbi:MAG: radical SAM protein [Deltaproteobacteria bacterium]|nr:radical SAM protein [Deltaproteobacteria bacterium]
MPPPTLQAIDRAFRDGVLELSAPPTRFYLNLTERCSLRCRHCITRAPELTASGAARDMSLEVVEALRPHLAHATYVGFPHAGEPLIAPALEPVLRALQEERARTGARPADTVVHLLTNGLALTEERFARLCGLGVCSWSVSMDGMSPQTNDRLRLGGHIERLLEQLQAITHLKRTSFPSVRLGVAWTVTRSNLHEVPQLLEWAAATGLDWVKLEEVFPLNPDAALEADLAPQRLLAALAEARAAAAALGVRLLEHVFETPVFKCRLGSDPEMARFSLLDDFANRMEINGCRLPYELVCIEPDGDLKPLSFHHPVGGNLLREGLSATWSSARFFEARAQMRAERPCGGGPATCSSDPGPDRW